MRDRICHLAAILAFLMFACPANATQEVDQLRAQVNQLQNQVSELQRRSSEPPATQPVDQLVPICPNDLLRISISDLAGPGIISDRDTRVDGEGNIQIPFIKPIKVVGMKIPAAEQAIVLAYRQANIVQNEIVRVFRSQLGQDSHLPIGPLSPGDFVRVTMLDITAPGAESIWINEVDEQGVIHLPYVGAIKIGGLTDAGAMAVINKAFVDANIESNPAASVLRVAHLTVPASQP